MGKFFSEREIRAVAIFLPLAAIVVCAVILLQPRTSPRAARQVEAQVAQAFETRADSIRLRPFDPNTVRFEELRRLGLTKYEAIGLLRFRETGKVFRIPEDVALCYTISDSLYERLKPYIHIARRFAITPRDFRAGRIVADKMPPASFRIDTVSATYLQAIGALTRRQAKAFIRWRELSGIYDMEDLRECYVVNDSVATALEPYVIFPERKVRPIDSPVELNTADSATLRSVTGIGERTVGAIMRYRERLGGFHRAEQLTEVPGVTEANYEKILKQIYCDSCKIQKIDINFARPNELGRHPYIGPQTLRKLLKTRQLKGGWSTAEEMIEDDILTREQAIRLLPYMRFGRQSGPIDE